MTSKYYVQEIEPEYEHVSLTENEPEAVPVKHTLTKSENSRGGKKGGPARAAKLSAEDRKRISKLGSQARWKK